MFEAPSDKDGCGCFEVFAVIIFAAIAISIIWMAAQLTNP